MTDIVIHDAYILTVNDRNQLFERVTIADLPKRSPARLLTKLGVQAVKDKI